MLGAANRDPAVSPSPDRFDPQRENAARHVSFGVGKHYCLGAPLAKLEVAVVLEELTLRFPALSLVEGEELEFHPNVSFRGPRRLHVRW